MKQARRGFPNSIVVHEEDLWIGGQPALDYTLRTAKGSVLKGRAISVGATVAAIEMITLSGKPPPTEKEVSSFFGSFTPLQPLPTPTFEAGPQWISVRHQGFSALHTRNRVTTTLPEGGGPVKVDVTYSVYADRLYMTGSWDLQAAIETQRELESFFGQLDSFAGLIAHGLGTSSPAIKGTIRSAVNFGDPPKAVLEGDTNDGISFRLVVTPIGKRVIFRSFAGPTPMLDSKHVTRWFNGFRLDPR